MKLRKVNQLIAAPKDLTITTSWTRYIRDTFPSMPDKSDTEWSDYDDTKHGFKEGYYLHSWNHVKYSDGNETNDFDTLYYTKGTKLSETISYSSVKTAMQPAENTFTLSIPPSLVPGDYLWSLVVITYSSDHGTGESKLYSVSRVGSDGNNGNGIHLAYATSITFDNNNNVTACESFSTTWFNGAKWIGVCVLEEQGNTEDPTSYASYKWSKIEGPQGPSGTSSQMHEWYLLSNSSTVPTSKPTRSSSGTATGNGWTIGENATRDQLTPTESSPYLWNIEETVYIDNNGKYTSVFSVAHLDTWWVQGGKGISSISDTYCASSDGKSWPTSGYDTFSNAILTWSIDKPFLWDKTTVYYDDKTSSIQYHVCSIFGREGQSGFVLDKRIPHYLATSSSSGVTTDTEGWTEEPQTVTTEKKYLWYYETFEYKSISEKGKNLLLGTQTFSDGVLDGDSHSLRNITDSSGTAFKVMYAFVDTDINNVKRNYALRGITVSLKGTLENPTSLPIFAIDTNGNISGPVAGTSYRIGTSIYVSNGSSWEENKQTFVDCLFYNGAISPLSGMTYTLSFIAKGSCLMYAYFYPDCVVEMVSSDGQKSTWNANGDGCACIKINSTTFSRYWIRWKVGTNVSGTKNVLPVRFFRESTANYIYIYAVKFSLEESISEWTPNPDDLQYSTTPVIIGVCGEKGSRGATLRGPQAWSDVVTGFQFLSGAEGEQFVDIVIYNDNYYVCNSSHTKTSSNNPATSVANNDGKWKLGQKFDLVATKILLATYALVKNLGVEAIDMKDANGNIVFQAKDGNVIANKGTFKNIVVEDSVVNGVFTSENTTTMNKIVIDAKQGWMKFFGPDHVKDEAPDMPETGAKQVELLRIAFETDADSLKRYAAIQIGAGITGNGNNGIILDPYMGLYVGSWTNGTFTRGSYYNDQGVTTI